MSSTSILPVFDFGTDATPPAASWLFSRGPVHVGSCRATLPVGKPAFQNRTIDISPKARNTHGKLFHALGSRIPVHRTSGYLYCAVFHKSLANHLGLLGKVAWPTVNVNDRPPESSPSAG